MTTVDILLVVCIKMTFQLRILSKLVNFIQFINILNGQMKFSFVFWIGLLYSFKILLSYCTWCCQLIVVECYVTWRRRTDSTDVTTCTSRWRHISMSALSLFCLFWFGLTVTLVVTEVGKLSAGRLRPHFIDVCRPDITAINCSLGYLSVKPGFHYPSWRAVLMARQLG